MDSCVCPPLASRWAEMGNLTYCQPCDALESRYRVAPVPFVQWVRGKTGTTLKTPWGAAECFQHINKAGLVSSERVRGAGGYAVATDSH